MYQYEVNVDCNGYRIMTPSAFRLVPLRPQYTRHSQAVAWRQNDVDLAGATRSRRVAHLSFFFSGARQSGNRNMDEFEGTF